MEFKRKIVKINDSLYLGLPKYLCIDLKITPGDEATIIRQDKALIILFDDETTNTTK